MNWLERASRALGRRVTNWSAVDAQLLLQGQIAARQVRAIDSIQTLADVEFCAHSQNGEDGIIEWLVSKIPEAPRTFIEFGVQDYRESNTRFLLRHRDWRGFVIDGSASNVASLRAMPEYWRHDLVAEAAFIDAENVTGLLAKSGFGLEPGILSIDIDGNDYWVLKALSDYRPWMLIVEYNALFGDLHAITTPYDPVFQRTKAHHSNLYFGASILAIAQLVEARGYTMMGSNLTGANAFFVRNEIADRFNIADRGARPTRARQSRDASGALNFLRGDAQIAEIGHLPVVEVPAGRRVSLDGLGKLCSTAWSA